MKNCVPVIRLYPLIQCVHWDFMDISATPSVLTHGMGRYAVHLARITQTTVPRPIATLL